MQIGDAVMEGRGRKLHIVLSLLKGRCSMVDLGERAWRSATNLSEESWVVEEEEPDVREFLRRNNTPRNGEGGRSGDDRGELKCEDEDKTSIKTVSPTRRQSEKCET